jgi:hypothetical protein
MLMGMTRIQIVIDVDEREEFRACAKAAGLSLSEWLRELGRERVAATHAPRLVTRDDLLEFFDEVRQDHRPGEREPDWDVTKARSDAERFDALDPLGIDT